MIYCVEDDASIRGMMVYTLKASGFEAEGIEDGTALSQALSQNKPELILLDLNLPGEDGISILSNLKSNPSTEDIPIIIATARDTEYDKVIGLDNGADDYLAKPFGMMEMVSRVKAVMRRYQPRNQAKGISVGKITLDEIRHTVFVCGHPIKLTSKEYELLRLLIKNPNTLYSREELFKAIWEQDKVEETRTVDVHIGTLRTKIGECSNYIETVRGIGYRLRED